MTICYKVVFEIYVSMFGKTMFNEFCVSSGHCSAYGRERYMAEGDILLRETYVDGFGTRDTDIDTTSLAHYIRDMFDEGFMAC